MNMVISMIVARAQDGAIGKDNDLLWSLPDDMRYFKETTKHHAVLSGRKNFESLPPKFRPLPNRENIVITRNKDWSYENTAIFHSIEAGIEYAKSLGETELFIIGGGEIYELGLKYADKLYVTEVYTSFPEAHAYFPDFDTEKWIERSRKKHPKDAKHAFDFDFVIFEKKPS